MKSIRRDAVCKLMQIGEYLYNFNLPSTTGKTLSANDLVGKSLVVFVYLCDGSESCAVEACGFRDLCDEFARLNVAIVGIGVESVESHKSFAEAHALPFPLLSDPTGQACARFGAIRSGTVEGKTAAYLSRTTLLFGPNFRVLKTYTDVESRNHAAEVLDDARSLLHPEPPRRIITHAPVLLVPDVLPKDVCRTLIELWETDNEDSGFMKQLDGKTIGMTDYSHKIRRDHFIKPGEIQTRVQGYIGKYVVPEMHKAFNYTVSRREDFRVACYDSVRGGYFRPHRDNTTEGTAHRRFAMSLLLNDEYEGGFLRFPEFGEHTYRPSAGSAVVFSCSLLHEATDVTAGRRFVLLSFLYGEAEAKAREAYNARVGGSYKA